MTRSTKRSEAYKRHAELLLSLAEEALISSEGHLISLRGLNKLRNKVDQMNTKKVS